MVGSMENYKRDLGIERVTDMVFVVFLGKTLYLVVPLSTQKEYK